ncbi:hypothetical protein [Streptomyces sp. NBC_01373]|uniref:hypothetical protein n=1 Tax=Streptomyces sp. NBC_01373 TaxID=2903843 RepID=UPI002256C89C|nr:hypothetical protein [Streptomyces sp. NBC_01373]MCX4697014.1 hypothetical protein [Streptomyces sp. NBC_01373]MCX4707061.1 hypothetical protein [Streptomyces sp. NBC_01373]
MSRKDAAARAVDAGTVAAQAVGDYGLTSPQALSALQTANTVMQQAQSQGCTKADFDAEHARRR